MAEFVVRTPGQPNRVIALVDRPLVVGRSEECDVQVLEKKASKRHLRFVPLAKTPGAIHGVTWVVEDLQSSNGTRMGDERVLRRALVSGDRVLVGDTVLEFVDTAGGEAAEPSAAAPVVVLSGNLSLAAAPVAAAPAAAAAAPVVVAGPAGDGTASPIEREDTADEGPSAADVLRASLAGRRAVARAAVFAVVAALVLVAVQVFVGGIADRRALGREEAEAYESILAERDRPSEILEAKLAAFVARFPTSRMRPDLERVVDARKADDARLHALEDELESLTRNTAGRSESDVLARLLALGLRVDPTSALARRIGIARDDAARRRDEALARERQAADADIDRSLARGDVSAAQRRLTSFEASHPALPAAEVARVAARRADLRAAATKLADAALAKAQAETDPDARRAALFAALRGLQDTVDADRLMAALHGVSGGAVPAAGPTPAAPTPSPGAAPAAPPTAPATPDALAQASDAERLARERKWAAAAEVYRRLVALEIPTRLKGEWTERADDLARVARLVDDLQALVAAGGDRPPHVKLEGGTFEVLGADAARARLRRGDKETVLTWPDAPVPDLLALLSAPKPTPDRHLALAILAADLGQRAEAVSHLLPLVDEASHRDAAFRVMARRLEGRARVPEGGYQALDGELLDRAEFAKRSEAKHVAALEAEAAQLVAKTAAEPAFKSLDRVRARRDELDRRRAYALLAIFNEKQWPYPHNDPKLQTAYAAVTAEVEQRWKSVEEVWNEPLSVKLPKGGAWEKLVERHAAIVKELEAKGKDVASLSAAMAPYALYVGETSVTVRTYVRSPDEKDLLAYNRWVMDVYNPKMTAYATEPEREEIRITNEYRTMMGWAFRVESGPTPVEKIDASNVIAALDQGRELGRVPLYALRIDDRLVRSSRAHSDDQVRRGYFAHEAPANPATGEPATMPWDRMAKAGYTGGAASENITQGRSTPMEAHLSWLHSSGHHRNILSDWADQGVGQSGRIWTQNFGLGGGAAREIPGKAPATPPEEPTPK